MKNHKANKPYKPHKPYMPNKPHKPYTPEDISSHLEARGVKPTSTRILVYRALVEQRHPLSLRELDGVLDTVDRSSIFRTLTLLLEHHLIHVIEDGSGVARYEVCEGHSHCSLNDQHIHFYCLRCQRTYCFHSIHIPAIELPEGFVMEGVNYLVKGVCPQCSA